MQAPWSQKNILKHDCNTYRRLFILTIFCFFNFSKIIHNVSLEAIELGELI